MSSQPPPYPYPYSQAAQLDPRITLPRPAIDSALAPIVDSVLLPEELDIKFMRGFDLSVTLDMILESHPALFPSHPTFNIHTLARVQHSEPSRWSASKKRDLQPHRDKLESTAAPAHSAPTPYSAGQSLEHGSSPSAQALAVAVISVGRTPHPSGIWATCFLSSCLRPSQHG